MMKNTFKGFIYVALTVLATFSKAGENNPTVDVKVTGDRTFSLSLSNQEETVQAILKNKKGQVLAQRAFRDGISTLSFDLNGAKEGGYALELVDSEKIQKLPVELTDEKVSVSLDQSETYFFPMVYQKGDQVTVSKWAPEKEQIYVTIVDDHNRLVHQDIIKGAEHLAKRFDFSKVEDGIYEIRLACNKQIVSKAIEIE